MATKSKSNGKATAKPATGGAAKPVRLRPIEKFKVGFRIVGFGGPLVQHAWDAKVVDQLRRKKAGETTTKVRTVCDPAAEAEAACYKTPDGRYGIDGMALKKSILTAAHKDMGIERTLAAKAIFLHIDDEQQQGAGRIMPFCDWVEKYEIGEDTVRVGKGSADLRYRPYWSPWGVDATFEVDTAVLDIESFLTLVEWAGSRVGIGEWRPQKQGDYGRYRVDVDHDITVEKIAAKQWKFNVKK